MNGSSQEGVQHSLLSDWLVPSGDTAWDTNGAFGKRDAVEGIQCDVDLIQHS